MRKSTKIFYTITDSDIYYELGNRRVYFSSDLNLKRFEDRLDDFIDNESAKLKARYKVDFNNIEESLALSLYQRIEHRGYRVE